MIIVATELHVRSFRYSFEFFLLSARSRKQAKQSPGCIKAAVKGKGWRVGYTFTVWDNKEAMQQFRNSGVHKKAMSKIRKLSHQYKTLRWESDTIPGWDEAATRLAAAAFVMFK